MKKLHLNKKTNHFTLVKSRRLKINKEICFLIIIICLLHISVFINSAQGAELNDTISVSLKNNTLPEAFKIISKKSGYSFAFSKEFIPEDLKLTKEFINSTVKDIITDILRGTGITFNIIDEQIILTKKKTLSKYTISGYIKDKETGEPLFQATISDKKHNYGCVSDENGYYSLTLQEGIYTLLYSYIGNKLVEQLIILDRNIDFSVQLESNIELDEVVVIGNEKHEIIKRTDPLGKISISNENIESMPVIMAEPDIMKSIQLIPGIQGGQEGNGEVYVRGGGPLQNLFLIDNVPIYNCFHLLGLFSVFNSDVIESTDVIKGGFPAQYGGRLSSVIDVKTKDGDVKEFKGIVSLGLVSSKLFLEGPLVKEKTSFTIAGRFGYYYLYGELLPSVISDSYDNNISNYNFKDLNFNVTHKLSDNHKLKLSVYYGDDTGEEVKGHDRVEEYYQHTYSFRKVIQGQNWNNLIGSLKWEGKISEKLTTSVQFSTSQYKYNNYESDTNFMVINHIDTTFYFFETSLNNKVVSYYAMTNLNYEILPYLKLNAGYKYSAINLDSDNKQTTNSNDFSMGESNRKDTILSKYDYKTSEHAGYVEFQILPWKRFSITPGVHLSYYKTGGYENTVLQPRVSSSWEFINNIILKASYTKMAQHMHLLGATRIKQASDLLVPAVEKAPSEESDQYSLGFSFLRFKNYRIHIDAYYKQFENLINFSEGASYFTDSPLWVDKIEIGTGDAKGIELLIEKPKGKLNGWIGYTYSNTTRKFEEINLGKSFPFIYDHRHYFNIVGNYHFNNKWDIGVNWLYHTGSKTTIPSSFYYSYSNDVYGRMQTWNNTKIFYNQKNTYVLPSYHRLDISINYKRKNRWGQGKWSLSVYNVYNRKNVYTSEYGEDFAQILGPIGYGRRYINDKKLLGIIPSLSYSLSF
ncbi:MAG: hypothetical protein A2W99_15225 [Bacteroidetes bacterium GWF2_33_16]|nr:MAG: hypothetical protein A2X00_09435 [Bacteroidetes bacterium GWE2_32_14]OFY07675.1 MAG: hypothetical protein A2W99_15225 [Bacteroidetes bacterium GWF2_33_16]